jgi:hypothetical protein
MRKVQMLMIAAAICGVGLSAHAAPQLDAKGKCRDGGKFVAASHCKSAAAKPSTRCHDSKGKFVSCSAPGAKPVK